MSTTDNKKAIENIAKRLYSDWGVRGKREGLTWETLPEYRKDVYRNWVKEYVLIEFPDSP